MTHDTIETLARLHGVTAWASTVALAGVAILFLRSRRAASPMPAWASPIALALTATTSALGVLVHDPYRSELRQKLFLASTKLGWLFERKLHLAFGCALLASLALASTSALRRATEGSRRDLARSAALGWIVSALFALAASVISAVVAKHRHF